MAGVLREINDVSYTINDVSSNLGFLPIFRSPVQAGILHAILSTSTPLSTVDLIRYTGSPQPTVHREVTRLVDSGLLDVSRIGRSTLYSASASNPLIAPLRSLVMLALSPQPKLRQALLDIPGIHLAIIHGPFAARAAGRAGPNPSSIDVLVVGAPDRTAVYAAMADVEAAVRREINVTFLSRERWEAADEEVVTRIRNAPTLDLLAE
jgi:DNA-binding transcriptional ArsR family regulator